MELIKPMRRLPLQGTSNTRDLGGYPCAGGVTRWQVFVRSDRPCALPEADIARLRAYGLRGAVDLRGSGERELCPSSFTAAGGFADHHVPLSDRIHDIDYQGDLPGSMSGLYIWILDEGADLLAGVFRVFAGGPGGWLFNCTVGKDRTGMVAMLLLGLAGVADADIVADYAATEVYMREVFGDMAQEREIPQYVLRSKPESMRRTLEHLNATYGGAESYLLKAGVTRRELDELRARFVEPSGMG